MSDSTVPVDNLSPCFGHTVSVLAVCFMAVLYCSIPSVQDLWPEFVGKQAKMGGLCLWAQSDGPCSCAGRELRVPFVP